MNHEDAVREMAIEKYLLGELTGSSRDDFEEHLFDCQLCAADLRAGVTLFEGARRELAANPREAMSSKRRSFLPAWLSPMWLAPALVACLLLFVYQSVVVVPDIKRELAEARAPAVLNTLVLAGGTSRGASMPSVTAPENGSFLLSVDIPASSDYSGYVCFLYAPSGTMVWSGKVTSEQAFESVQIHIPFSITRRGENTLVVDGVRGDGPDAKMEVLETDKFILQASK